MMCSLIKQDKTKNGALPLPVFLAFFSLVTTASGFSNSFIATTRGKYKGGVKIADGYRLDRKYLNPKQQHLLKRLSKTLSGEDREIMESILRDFTLKEASEAAPGS